MVAPRPWVVAGAAVLLAAGLLGLHVWEGRRATDWEQERVQLLRHDRVLRQRILVVDSATKAAAEAYWRATAAYHPPSVVVVPGVPPPVIVTAGPCAGIVAAADSALAAKDRSLAVRDTALAVKDSLIHLLEHPVVRHVEFVAGGYWDFLGASPVAAGGVDLHLPLLPRTVVITARAIVPVRLTDARPSALVGVEVRW